MKVLVITTENSTYELDLDHKLARRVKGTESPTERFAPDGEWHPYVETAVIVLGQPMIIHWPDGQPELRDNSMSSLVTGIEVDIRDE